LKLQSECVILTVREGKAICPTCGRPTPVRILPETRLELFPLFCKTCKQTTLVSYREREPLSESH
jgi:hypothetical protein